MVDHCEAVNAVTAGGPQAQSVAMAMAMAQSMSMSQHHGKAKTRREVDPWWEVSLDQLCHVHSVRFKIGCSKQSDLAVFVFLLKVQTITPSH